MQEYENDEKEWIKRLVSRKHQGDLLLVSYLFQKHHSKLLDATVRRHFYDLCYKCQGEEDEFHICEEQTANFVLPFGSKILKFATDEERTKAWEDFLDGVVKREVFKRTLVQWLKTFKSVEDSVDKNRDSFYQYMLNHFPNHTQNPHQHFLEYEDYDMTD
jgi:hypothetical protein